MIVGSVRVVGGLIVARTIGVGLVVVRIVTRTVTVTVVVIRHIDDVEKRLKDYVELLG